MRVINILKCLEMAFFLTIFQWEKIRINSKGGELTLKTPLQLTLEPTIFQLLRNIY